MTTLDQLRRAIDTLPRQSSCVDSSIICACSRCYVLYAFNAHAARLKQYDFDEGDEYWSDEVREIVEQRK